MKHNGKFVAHCESCGQANPQTDDGYTTCCNELVCYGGPQDGFGKDRFGVEDNYVTACCWAMAEERYRQQRRAIPEGASRLFLK